MRDWVENALLEIGQWAALAGLDWSEVAWGAGIALAMFIGSLVAVTWLILLMPSNYFTNARGGWADRHPVLRWSLLFLKNLLGVVLVAMGAVMLVTPGQGVLTILIGVALLNFPGKRVLERKLLLRLGALRAINRVRRRFGKPPVVVEKEWRKPRGEFVSQQSSCVQQNR